MDQEKVVCTYNGVSFNLKKKEILLYATMQYINPVISRYRNLADVPSEINQSRTARFHLYEISTTVKLQGSKEQHCGCPRLEGRGNGAFLINRCNIPLTQYEKRSSHLRLGTGPIDNGVVQHT